MLLSAHAAYAQGRYSGKITDPNGEPMFSVMVVAIDNSAIGALTDFEGVFSIQVPDDKSHIYKISYLGFEDIYDTLALVGGKNITKDYTIREQSVTTGEVVVEAKASRAAATYMEKIRMNSVVSLDYISSETIKKTGDNNVLNAISRVTGVSTGNGLVTVRGIGDRYVRTTLNGSRIPTLDPMTNNFKLDIFPASLVDNIVVTKTQSPEYSAEWSGAFISVETKDYPDQLTVNVESQWGYNDQSTWQNFLTNDRSKTDWLGFDNSLRPRSTNEIIRPQILDQTPGLYDQFVALGLGDYFASQGINGWVDDGSNTSRNYAAMGYIQLGLMSAGEINDPAAFQTAQDQYIRYYASDAYRLVNPNNKDYNNGFSNNWTTRYMKAPMNFSQSASVGNQTTFLGKRLGYFIGARYGRSFRFDPLGTSQRLRVASDEEVEAMNYLPDRLDSAIMSRETNSWSALFNLAYEINKNHKVNFLFMPNMIGVNDIASYSSQRLKDPSNGQWETNQDINIAKNLFYEQRKQFIYQVGSQHFIPALKLKTEFNASYTDGYSSAPDFRQLEYVRFVQATPTNSDSIIGYMFGPTVGDGIRRFFRYVDENLWDIRLGSEFPLNENVKIKSGIAAQRLFRKTDNDEFQVFLGNGSAGPLQNEDINTYLDPSHFVMADSTIDYFYANNYEPRNHSFGHSNVNAAYVMGDVEWRYGLRFSGGVRLEATDIFTDVDKFYRMGYVRDDPRRANIPGFPNVNAVELKQTDILPSISLIWKREGEKWGRSNVRVNYSKSLARPSIRELTDAAILDNEFRTMIYGNSDLRIAKIDNYDVRLEHYFENRDQISASVFYKDFTDHIEMGFGNIGITWDNVAESNVRGIEIEGRKGISDFLEVRANLTIVQSESKFIRRDFGLVDGVKEYVPIDTLYRPMYGQAPYIFNTIVTTKLDSLGITATLSYNVQGPRLVITGAVRGIPDVYERVRNIMDFKVTKNLGEHFFVGLTVRDIFNAPVRRSYVLSRDKMPGLGAEIKNAWYHFTDKEKVVKPVWFDYDSFRYGRTYLINIGYRL